MKSLQDQIVAWLAETERAPNWYKKGTITDDTDWFYIEKGVQKKSLADAVSRALRHCEEEKRIARRDNGKSCEYRFLPPEHRDRYIPWSLREDKGVIFRSDDREVELMQDGMSFEKLVEPKKRTLKQNDSLHLFLQLLSDELNNAGLDMKAVLKPEVDIPWNVQNAKEYLWRPIQKALLRKESTTNLETSEVSQVWEILNRHLGEKFGIHVDFPSHENTDEFINSYKN